MGVLLDHGVSLCFVSFLALRTLQVTFHVENSIRSAPASTALTQVLHQSHNARTANRHLRGSGERNIDASVGAAAVGKQTHPRDKAMLFSEEIKPVAIAIIELCLSEGISSSVSQRINFILRPSKVDH